MKNACKTLGCDKLIESCYYFFKTIKNEKIFVGKNLEDAGIALVYLFLRIYNHPYTLYDFRKVGFDDKLVFRQYRDFVKKLKIWNKIKPQNILQFVLKIVNDLIQDEPETYRVKNELINWVRIYFTGLYGRIRPASYADIAMFDGGVGLSAIGACIYLATKRNEYFKNVTQKGICDFCGCTEVTLREYIKKIRIIHEIEESQ